MTAIPNWIEKIQKACYFHFIWNQIFLFDMIFCNILCYNFFRHVSEDSLVHLVLLSIYLCSSQLKLTVRFSYITKYIFIPSVILFYQLLLKFLNFQFYFNFYGLFLLYQFELFPYSSISETIRSSMTACEIVIMRAMKRQTMKRRYWQLK